MTGNKRRATALVGSVVTVAVAAVAPFLGVGEAAAAPPIVVTTTSDAGDGSLRAAIAAANLADGPDVITFQADLMGTITLAPVNGQLWVGPGGLTITGPGASSLTVDGAGTERVFYLQGDSEDQNAVTISGLTINNGYAEGSGGNIYSYNVDLTLQSVVVSDGGAAGDGGGIFLTGELGSLLMSDSQLVGNGAYFDGGGLFADGSEGSGLVPVAATAGEGITIERSVISGNEAGQEMGRTEEPNDQPSTGE